MSAVLKPRERTAAVDWEAVKRDLHGLNVITAPNQRKQLS
jgi:hypothetical protein